MVILRLPLLNVALFALFISWAQPACSQSEVSEQGDFEQLTLELSTPKKEYKLLEPLPILITLHNRTERVVMGHSAFDFGANYIELFVKETGSQLKKINQLTTDIKLVIADPRAMEPKSEFHQMQLLSLGLDQIFPKPGKYQIVAKLYDLDRKKSVTSKPLTIRVVFPLGVDYQAFEYIKAHGNPTYFFTGRHLRRNLQMMETFVSAFGESTYGDYATFNVAQYHFVNQDYEKAQQHFEKLAKKRDFVFSEAASRYLDKIKKPNEPEP